MLENLKNDFNETTTQNGAFAHKSTKSNVLDLFALGGAYRERSESDVEQLVSKAYAENPLLTMKALFYLRDVRGGQGERRFFRVGINYLAKHNPQSVKKNIQLIPEFGRWDDLVSLIDTSLKSYVLSVISNQLAQDILSNNPSLLAKWLPSENASSPITKSNATKIRKGLKMSPRQYRKTLSKLRKSIGIIETKITEKDYSEIEYDKIPSKAGMIYRQAFLNNDYERYSDFLDKVSTGEKTMNAGTLYPYEITNKALAKDWYWNSDSNLSEEEILYLDNAWNSLPDYIGENTENSIAVVDVSGSMNGRPMDVATSLGIYLAEKNEGAFHNHFLTFSSEPQLQELVGTNIVEKVTNLSRADWGMSTNVEKVFQKLLDVAVKDSLSQDEMVSKVYIITDMQFNQCIYGADEHIFKNMAKKFESHGFKLPELVFWNVNAFTSNVQFTMNEIGVQMVSGFSPSIFENLLRASGLTPYELMLEVLESERYESVTA